LTNLFWDLTSISITVVRLMQKPANKHVSGVYAPEILTSTCAMPI